MKLKGSWGEVQGGVREVSQLEEGGLGWSPGSWEGLTTSGPQDATHSPFNGFPSPDHPHLDTEEVTTMSRGIEHN